MGAALLVLAANYGAHLFIGLRFSHPSIAIFINLSTYFLAYWLFSSSLTLLLNRHYLTRRRFVAHLIAWLLFTVASGTVLLILPHGVLQKIGLVIMASWLFIYGVWLARRLLRTYRRAVRIIDNYHSDYIASYVRWLSIFTYWAVIYGVSCGLLTFLPDRYIDLWILSSIPFYIYLFCAYMNYMLFYERVEQILTTEMGDETIEDENLQLPPAIYANITQSLDEWLKTEQYTNPELTIEEVARAIDTNRTYLSGYIKENYQSTFREWVTALRIEYAKQVLANKPDITITTISKTAGFRSQSYFSKIFAEKEGCPPAKWRKEQTEKVYAPAIRPALDKKIAEHVPN